MQMLHQFNDREVEVGARRWGGGGGIGMEGGGWKGWGGGEMECRGGGIQARLPMQLNQGDGQNLPT